MAVLIGGCFQIFLNELSCCANKFSSNGTTRKLNITLLPAQEVIFVKVFVKQLYSHLYLF